MAYVTLNDLGITIDNAGANTQAALGTNTVGGEVKATDDNSFSTALINLFGTIAQAGAQVGSSFIQADAQKDAAKAAARAAQAQAALNLPPPVQITTPSSGTSPLLIAAIGGLGLAGIVTVVLLATRSSPPPQTWGPPPGWVPSQPTQAPTRANARGRKRR